MAEVLINIDNLSINFAGRETFSGLAWEIQDGQRVGLVGPNGAGKSTLLKLIGGELAQESGAIFRRPGLTWARLPQEPEMTSGRTVLEEVLTAVPEVAEIEAGLRKLEARMGQPAVYSDADSLSRVMDAHAQATARFAQIGGQSYQSRVEEALTRVGLAMDTWDRPLNVLSGGQKKLVLLARLVVRRPNVLLLDEPDNHLDIPAKRHLEQLIRGYPGCVIIISHDRYLLDEVASDVAELENGKLTLYQGNYTAYSNERELRRLRQQQLYAAQQKEITRIEAAIARFELWASMVVNERHIRQARSRQKMLDKMDKIEKVQEARRMNLNLDGWRGSKKAVQLANVSRLLPDGSQIWRELNLTLWHGERVGLVGPNGSGKSLLFRHLVCPAMLDEYGEGEIKIGPSSKIGYYAQEQETLNLDWTPLRAVIDVSPMNEGSAVSFLNRFLFSYDQVRGPIGDLSGGERSRLQLARVVLMRPNLLLLDEPTNNLDITSIEVLEQTLEEFEGTVFVISHDRYFLDRVVDRVVELREAQLTEFVGGYTDYLAEVEQ